jgi:hypothetical protein
MKKLLEKASEILSLKYEFLKNLKGLRVLDLRKIMNVGHLSAGGGITTMEQLMKAHN